jgi:hypothetical protein
MCCKCSKFTIGVGILDEYCFHLLIFLAMRVLDISGMGVVFHGREWPYPDVDPSSRCCISHLERNESLVTWLQPPGGQVEDQIPAIRVKDKFCALSLRMQKSLFRHVRLRKNFVNLEPLSNGTYKLRIPLLLLHEKIRTQTRFNVGYLFLILNVCLQGFLLFFNVGCRIFF